MSDVHQMETSLSHALLFYQCMSRPIFSRFRNGFRSDVVRNHSYSSYALRPIRIREKMIRCSRRTISTNHYFHGFESDVVRSHSYGETRPIASCASFIHLLHFTILVSFINTVHVILNSLQQY
jgi:hypothetical protein